MEHLNYISETDTNTPSDRTWTYALTDTAVSEPSYRYFNLYHSPSATRWRVNVYFEQVNLNQLPAAAAPVETAATPAVTAAAPAVTTNPVLQAQQDTESHIGTAPQFTVTQQTALLQVMAGTCLQSES